MNKTPPISVLDEAPTAGPVASPRLYSRAVDNLLETHDLMRDFSTEGVPVEVTVLRALLERVGELVSIAKSLRDRLESAAPTTMLPAAMLQRPMLSPADLAAVLGVSKQALYAMVERGQIPGVMRPGKRKLLFRTADLVPWLQGRAPSSNRSRR